MWYVFISIFDSIGTKVLRRSWFLCKSCEVDLEESFIEHPKSCIDNTAVFREQSNVISREMENGK